MPSLPVQLSLSMTSSNRLIAAKPQDNQKVVPLPELTPEEKRFQQQRLRDICLLLENITLKEETTIKLILDCLYDIGVINLINKKIPHPPLNKLAKKLASTPKPLFRIIAWRWVRRNLPIRVTNWLHNRVKFK